MFHIIYKPDVFLNVLRHKKSNLSVHLERRSRLIEFEEKLLHESNRECLDQDLISNS